MADPELLARIDENVKYLVKARLEDRAALDTHIGHDDKIMQDYLRPLWEAHQQNIGASKNRTVGATVLGYAINASIAVTAAWAAVKGLGK